MVDLSLVVKCSSVQMVVWKSDWKKPANGPKCMVFKWSAKSCDFILWKPDTQCVWYSDGYCISLMGSIAHFVRFFCPVCVCSKLQKSFPKKLELKSFEFWVGTKKTRLGKTCFMFRKGPFATSTELSTHAYSEYYYKYCNIHCQFIV